MAEYIDKAKLMESLEIRRDFLFSENGDYDHYTNGFDEAVDRVEDFPVAADVVEVVRCKDCKHFAAFVKPYNKVGTCRKSVGLNMENHFCSYGERRADDAQY